MKLYLISDFIDVETVDVKDEPFEQPLLKEKAIPEKPQQDKRSMSRAEKMKRTLAEKRRRIKYTKKFPCPFCPSGFSSSFSLKKHLMDVCNQEPKYKCPYCTYKSKWSNDIMKHTRNRHRSERSYFVTI